MSREVTSNIRKPIVDTLANFFGEAKTNYFFDKLESKNLLYPPYKFVNKSLLKKNKSKKKIRLNITDEIQMLMFVGSLMENYGDVSAAEKLYNKSYELSAKANNEYYIVKSLIHRGNLYLKNFNYVNSERDFKKCLKYANNQRMQILIDYSLGLLYLINFQDEKSIKYFKKILKDDQIENYRVLLGNSLLNIGLAYLLQKKASLSLSYLTNSLSYLENAGSINQFAIAHYYLGYAYLIQKNIKDALKEFDFTAQIIGQTDDRLLKGLINFGKAQLQYVKGDSKLSLVFLNKAISDFQAISNEKALANSLVMKGFIYKNKKSEKLRKAYFQAAKRINPNLNTSKFMITPLLDFSYLYLPVLD